ncbi:MAG: hypothetical protein JWM76_351 [Pseudonocardiales bacterium]|nr:hypothetical protein [Pseudonocardiales bacterium]
MGGVSVGGAVTTGVSVLGGESTGVVTGGSVGGVATGVLLEDVSTGATATGSVVEDTPLTGVTVVSPPEDAGGEVTVSFSEPALVTGSAVVPGNVAGADVSEVGVPALAPDKPITDMSRYAPMKSPNAANMRTTRRARGECTAGTVRTSPVSCIVVKAITQSAVVQAKLFWTGSRRR